MEHRVEMPRRRRLKRRNETRVRDFIWSETDKSDARRRRTRRDDDKTKVEDAAAESSDDDSDDEDTPSGSSTIASPTAPPPGPTTLPPPPPPPPVATPPTTSVDPPPAQASTPAVVPLPTTTTSATLESQTLPPASTTLGTQTLPATNTPIAAGETTDPPRTQNGADFSRQSGVLPPAATTALAVLVSLGGASLLAFLFWKLYRRRRGRKEPDQSSGKEFYGGGPKSDIRVMDEAMAAVYKAESGDSNSAPSTRYSGFIPPRDDPSRDETADRGVSRWSDSEPGWFKRQVQRVKLTTKSGATGAAEEDDSAPKNAAVSKWMDRHASCMLDPMAARASVASSGVASLRGLGPVPSISPASVVGDPRESILSEMGQIRRAAVPPPLDPKMVERVRQMQEQNQMRAQEQARGPVAADFEQGALRPPPPMADRWGNSSPTAMSPAQTESTWNTWGVDQRRK